MSKEDGGCPRGWPLLFGDLVQSDEIGILGRMTCAKLAFFR